MKPLLNVTRLTNGDDFSAIIPWLKAEDSTASINEERLAQSWSTMNSLLISWLDEEQAVRFILTFSNQYDILQLL